MTATWRSFFIHRYGLDLRSLAIFRISLSLLIAIYLGLELVATDLSWRSACLGAALAGALLMAIGYRSRWAAAATWLLVTLLYNSSMLSSTAPSPLLPAAVLWGVLLPLAGSYSIDQALNTVEQPKSIFSGATLGLMIQLLALYWLEVASWQTAAAAVFPSLGLATFAATLAVPLLLWNPEHASRCRTIAAAAAVVIHGGWFCLAAGGWQSLLALSLWLALMPSAVWDRLAIRAFTPQRLGLNIYYDADCGFCKKVVHLLRTLLVLPRRVPLRTAQSDPAIHTAMETQNSWVIVDWQGQHYYKWQGIAYVVSLSPVFWPLARVLRWRPLMALGTRLYETIANNRRVAGRFTKPLKFQQFVVRPRPLVSLVGLAVALAILWSSIQQVSVIRRTVPAPPPLVRAIEISPVR